MINTSRLLDMFLKLAALDSPSLNEEKVCSAIKAILAEHDIDFIEDVAGIAGGVCGNLICRLPASPNVPQLGIMFSAHMDTVTPCTSKNIIVDRENDLIRTDGKTILGGDDLAGVCSILETFITLKRNNLPHGNLWGVFTIGEEIGLLGSKHIDLEKSGITAEYAYVLDSGGAIGTCDIAGPTQNIINLNFIGKTAHAGVEPEKGINAITVAANAIAAFPQGRIDEETTCNIGIISGGNATNIVCGSVHAEAEVRSHSKEKLDIVTNTILTQCQKTSESFNASFDSEVQNVYPAYSIETTSKVVTNFSNACKRLGITPSFEKTGGGSDTNFFNGKGLPSVNLSVGMNKVHTTEECLKISELNTACALVCELAQAQTEN